MTDSNATELLRELLDERGVEWADQFGPFPVTAYEGNGVTWIAKEYTAGKFSIETRPVTPEQAVAATLGSEREKALEEPVQEQANSNALRVCPFCGGEAGAVQKQYGDWRDEIGVICSKCNAMMLRPAIELVDAETHISKKAIAAWNARADTEYGSVPATEENMAKYGWVRERTCKFVSSKGSDYPPVCSACGYELGIYDCAWYEDGTYGYERNYCPNCGARVVG